MAFGLFQRKKATLRSASWTKTGRCLSVAIMYFASDPTSTWPLEDAYTTFSRALLTFAARHSHA